MSESPATLQGFAHQEQAEVAETAVSSQPAQLAILLPPLKTNRPFQNGGAI